MKFQIGKSGVTEGTITSLNNAFKTHKSVRVSVLKSAAPSKDKIEELVAHLARRLSGSFSYKIIGFTIVLGKRKKA